MIPDAAVEAAAWALWTPSDHKATWQYEYVEYKNPLREEARAALEAAAPHIRAQALEDAAEAWQVRMDTIGRGSVDAKLFMQQRAATERVSK